LRKAGRGKPKASEERDMRTCGEERSKGGRVSGRFSKYSSLRRKRTFRRGSPNTPPVGMEGTVEGMRARDLSRLHPLEDGYWGNGTGRQSASNTRRAKCSTQLDLAAEEADPADLLQALTRAFLGKGCLALTFRVLQGQPAARALFLCLFVFSAFLFVLFYYFTFSMGGWSMRWMGLSWCECVAAGCHC